MEAQGGAEPGSLPLPRAGGRQVVWSVHSLPPPAQVARPEPPALKPRGAAAPSGVHFTHHLTPTQTLKTALWFSAWHCPQISVSNTASWDVTSGRPLGSQRPQWREMEPAGTSWRRRGWISPLSWLLGPPPRPPSSSDCSALLAPAGDNLSPHGAPPLSSAEPWPPSWRCSAGEETKKPARGEGAAVWAPLLRARRPTSHLA